MKEVNRMFYDVMGFVIILVAIVIGFGAPLAAVAMALIDDAKETKEIDEWERSHRQIEEN